MTGEKVHFLDPLCVPHGHMHIVRHRCFRVKVADAVALFVLVEFYGARTMCATKRGCFLNLMDSFLI